MRADHIFVTAPEVFDWQYRNRDGHFNVALAVQEGAEPRILGFLGFIPTGHFDPVLGSDEIMLAIWKVREDLAPPGLGLRLLKLIQAQFKPEVIGAIGISDMVGPIYKAFKYRLDRLHHLALFNPDASEHLRIAQNVPEVAFKEPTAHENWTLTSLAETNAPEIHSKVSALAKGPGLRKSWAYIQARYLMHPWYSYRVMAISNAGELRAVLVWRRVVANGGVILRIVDVIGAGATLANVSRPLVEVLRAEDAEYIDLMQSGLDQAALIGAGWVCPDETPGLILPNFFAPFEARNIEIALAYKSFADPDRTIALFRADSDQDRPNQLSEVTPNAG